MSNRNSRWGGTQPRYTQQDLDVIAKKYYTGSTSWSKGARVTTNKNLDARRSAIRRYFNTATHLTPVQRKCGDRIIIEHLRLA